MHQRRNPFRSSLLIEPLRRRIGLAATALVVYAGGFILLYAQAGAGITALSVFPVVIMGWLFGSWGGLLTGLAIVPFNAVLLTVVGDTGWEVVLGSVGVEGSALVVVVGSIIGLLRDLGLRLDRHLTDWRRAERALRDTEDRYRVLFERSRDPIFVTRPEGQMLDVNDAMTSLLGYSKPELLDMNMVRLFEKTKDHDTMASKVRMDGFVKSFPVRLVHKDGDVRECLINSVARFDGPEVREFQGTIRDASVGPALHALAEQRTRQLQAAIAELEGFSYSVSHDLRTHLVTMGGFASLLWTEHRDALDEEGQGYLSRIVEASRRMDSFVGALLRYSKVSQRRIRPSVIRLNDAIAEALEVLQPQIAETSATVAVDGGLPDVRADPMLLGRIVENLVSNAIKFVPSERKPEVTIRASADDAWVRLEVEDNGIGMDPKDVPRAFRAFERLAPERFEGTGVGLAIVQKSAERMGGEVGLDSSPGQGSTAWIRLPALGTLAPESEEFS